MSFASFVDGAPPDFEEYLASSGAQALLKGLLQKLADEQPDDVAAFISNFALVAASEASQPVDEDEISVGEDIGDEIPEFVRHRKRRGAVSSEPNGEVQSISMSVEANPKDEETNRKLNEALSRHILCSHLDESERQEVFDHMFKVTYGPGEFVIRQGEDGDKFYVVDEGELNIYVNTPSERKLVQHVTTGGSFGELALIYNTPRAADVVAVTHVSLWVIDRVTYRRVLMDSTIRKRKMYEEFLDKVPILAPLQKYERLVVADALEPETFAKGEVIVKQGDCGDVFYIIIEGEAIVTQVDREGNPKHLVDLKPSDYFGEIALLTDRPRAATVTAASDSLKCVRLDRARFQRVLGPCEDILRRNMEAYSKYMAKQI